MGDVSWGIRAPRLEKMGTRIGLRGQFRRLDEHSDGFLVEADFNDGVEMEVGTYMEIAL